MTPIAAQCPHRQAKLKLKNPDLVGKKVRCPSCQEPFKIEAPEPEPQEDEWLDEDFNSFEEEPSAQAPPPIPGQKKKKAESVVVTKTKRKKRKSGEEEMSLAAHRLVMIGTGIAGGVVGALIWGAVMYFSHFEVGHIAILVGMLTGIGVRLGAGKWDYGWWPAMTGVAIALVAIIGGKVLCVHFILHGLIGDLAEHAVPVQANMVAFHARELADRLDRR